MTSSTLTSCHCQHNTAPTATNKHSKDNPLTSPVLQTTKQAHALFHPRRRGTNRRSGLDEFNGNERIERKMKPCVYIKKRGLCGKLQLLLGESWEDSSKVSVTFQTNLDVSAHFPNGLPQQDED